MIFTAEIGACTRKWFLSKVLLFDDLCQKVFKLYSIYIICSVCEYQSLLRNNRQYQNRGDRHRNRGYGRRTETEQMIGLIRHSKIFTSYLIKCRKNKKVLLRERKRHTARRVASTRYAALSNPDLVGGNPSRPCQGGTLGTPHHPDLVGGQVPHPDLVRGYPRYHPPSRPGQGYPRYSPTIQTWDGVPPTWDGVPPNLGQGTPPDLRWGTPLPRPEMGYPPTQTWDGVPPT